MKLGTKLLLAPLLTAVVLLGIGQVASWMNTRQAGTTRALHEQQLGKLKQLAGSQEEVVQLHTSVYRNVTLVPSYDEAKVKAVRAELVQRAGAVKTGLGALSAGNAHLEGVVKEIGTLIDRYVKSADAALDMASVDSNTGIAAMQNADVAFAGLSDLIDKVQARVELDAGAETEAVAAQARRLNGMLSVAGLVIALAALAAARALLRRSVSDIEQASRVAARVAEGDLNQTITTTRRDEVGALLNALATMQAQLRDVVGEVRATADYIATASSEVEQGNADLSTRTEQAASNLQQTAASLEQLTITVRQSAESASTANQLANTATQVAQRGGEVVSKVVATMNDINASSRKIADIIGTIDGIAFQTNILALNAAVEAARAGEQGRGFAVVAAEVRSLAKRSADAAKEIKSLIGASVDRVESGSKLVADAGSTMTDIVASVQRVTDIISEITAAASEQSHGIGQVNTAVTQLDQMTQQNSALVEQSAASATSLREQAGKLSDVVATFKLAPQS